MPSEISPSKSLDPNIALDTSLIRASQVTREEFDAANPGARLSFQLATLCARIVRGQRVGQQVGGAAPTPVLTESAIHTADEIYAAWRRLEDIVTAPVRFVWEKAKEAWTQLVEASARGSEDAVNNWLDNSVLRTVSKAVDMSVDAIKKGIGNVKQGLGTAQENYFKFKGEAFDWAIAAILIFVAYGYAKR